MKKILWLSDFKIDKELEPKEYKNYYQSIESEEDILNVLNKMNSYQLSENGFVGIFGLKDTHSMISSIIAEKNNFITTSFESIINCQNKYKFRQIESKIDNKNFKFWEDKDIQKIKESYFPLFIKPKKASLSSYSKLVHSKEEAKNFIKNNRKKLISLNKNRKDLLKNYFNDTNFLSEFILESVIEGDQFTADIFISNKKIIIAGITKSVYLKNIRSFDRFELTNNSRIYKIIKNKFNLLINGLGLNNTWINIEFAINNDKVDIIEINSRPSLQFMYLIYLVYNINPFNIITKIVEGKEIQDGLFDKPKNYNMAFSFVLRKSDDMICIDAPDEKNIKLIEKTFKGVKIRKLIEKNKRLSDYQQDSESFRYAIIDIPGNSKKEIFDNLEKIKKMINYKFVKI